jgi:hypothetical protein
MMSRPITLTEGDTVGKPSHHAGPPFKGAGYVTAGRFTSSLRPGTLR